MKRQGHLRYQLTRIKAENAELRRRFPREGVTCLERSVLLKKFRENVADGVLSRKARTSDSHLDTGGQIDRRAPFGCDVTEHQSAEEALKRSRREWMTIFHAIGHLTVIMDADHRIVQANQAVCRILGKPESELIGTHCFQWFHAAGSQRPPLSCPLRQMIVSGNMEMIEMEMEALGGNYIVSCTPVFDEEGRLQKIIHIATDITHLKKSEEEKKKLQKQLLQVQKMEALGTLTGGIAHDFNNILMGIQGYISLLLYDLNRDHPHRMKLENIESYVRRGADLTKQLLGFARGGKYDVKPTNMNDLLTNSADLFGRTRKEIFISKRFDNDLWTVDVDQGQMDQVILNLLINASQAMPGGGDLTIETDNGILDKRPPISFQRAADGFVEQARQALESAAGAGGPYFTVPRMVFAVPGTDARIFVGEFPKGAGVADPSGWDQGYVEAAKVKAGAAEFAHSRIRVAGQDALLFRIEAAAFRNDRVVFKTREGERVQIDFLLPTAIVGEMEAQVSASIASLEIR